MDQTPGDSPTDRLERLEQESAHLKAQLKRATRQISILQLALLLVVASLAGGEYYLIRTGVLRIEGLSTAVARSVEAKEFGFYNRFNSRVILEADDKFGLPQLIFMDLAKNYRLGIKVWPEGDGTPGMVFYDRSGMRGNFRMDGEGSAVLNLVGEGQKGGIALAVAKDGTPSLKVTDKTGKVQFEVPAASH
jgi:hypothetical protein